jgi:hypothetical protein
MKQLAEFSLQDGSSVLVEVERAEFDGNVRRGSSTTQLVEKAQDTFEAALERIRPAAEVLIGKLRGLSQAPDSVQIEFGLKLSASAGAVIASAATEANFKVSLTWKRRRPGEE